MRARTRVDVYTIVYSQLCYPVTQLYDSAHKRNGNHDCAADKLKSAEAVNGTRWDLRELM